MGKNKGQNFIITGTVYPFDIMVSIGETDNSLINNLKLCNVKFKELEIIKNSPTTKGYYCMFDKGQSLIRIYSNKMDNTTNGILSHEIFHCAFAILTKVGINLNRETEESYAYLIHFITQEIYKNILKWK